MGKLSLLLKDIFLEIIPIYSYRGSNYTYERLVMLQYVLSLKRFMAYVNFFCEL